MTNLLADVGSGAAPHPKTKTDWLINELISSERKTDFDKVAGKILLHLLRDKQHDELQKINQVISKKEGE